MEKGKENLRQVLKCKNVVMEGVDHRGVFSYIFGHDITRKSQKLDQILCQRKNIDEIKDNRNAPKTFFHFQSDVTVIT